MALPRPISDSEIQAPLAITEVLFEKIKANLEFLDESLPTGIFQSAEIDLTNKLGTDNIQNSFFTSDLPLQRAAIGNIHLSRKDESSKNLIVDVLQYTPQRKFTSSYIGDESRISTANWHTLGNDFRTDVSQIVNPAITNLVKADFPSISYEEVLNHGRVGNFGYFLFPFALPDDLYEAGMQLDVVRKSFVDQNIAVGQTEEFLTVEIIDRNDKFLLISKSEYDSLIVTLSLSGQDKYLIRPRGMRRLAIVDPPSFASGFGGLPVSIQKGDVIVVKTSSNLYRGVVHKYENNVLFAQVFSNYRMAGDIGDLTGTLSLFWGYGLWKGSANELVSATGRVEEGDEFYMSSNVPNDDEILVATAMTTHINSSDGLLYSFLRLTELGTRVLHNEDINSFFSGVPSFITSSGRVDVIVATPAQFLQNYRGDVILKHQNGSDVNARIIGRNGSFLQLQIRNVEDYPSFQNQLASTLRIDAFPMAMPNVLDGASGDVIIVYRRGRGTELEYANAYVENGQAIRVWPIYDGSLPNSWTAGRPSSARTSLNIIENPNVEILGYFRTILAGVELRPQYTPLIGAIETFVAPSRIDKFSRLAIRVSSGGLSSFPSNSYGKLTITAE